MINAKLAREKSFSIQNSMNATQLKEIEELINNAIEQGKCEIFYHKTLRDPVIAKLEELGYTVKNQNDMRNGIIDKITW